MKYKVTNISGNTLKIRDTFLGKDIVVGSGASITMNKPPVSNATWKVEEVAEVAEVAEVPKVSKVNYTEKLEKKPLVEKEGKKYDSKRSR